MMRNSLRIALGLTFLGACVVLVVSISRIAVAHFAARESEIQELRVTNARFVAALTQSSQMRQASAGGPSAFAADYLDSTQESIATADLQSRLRTMALERLVELAALNTLSPRQRGDATMIGVRLSVRAPLSAMQGLLHTIETRQPILFVERLVMRVDASGRSAALDEGGAHLTAEIDVYAPRRPQVLAAPTFRIEPAAGARP